MIDTADTAARGVPVHKAIFRYLAMLIGFVPMLAALFSRYLVAGDSADAMFTDSFFRWIAAAAVFGTLWSIVQIVQIVRKKDPPYDRLAGTAVVRV